LDSRDRLQKSCNRPCRILNKERDRGFGIEGVQDVKSISTYMIDGEVTEADVKKICEELLSDNQIQRYKYADEKEKLRIKVNSPCAWLVEVNFKEGVTDAVGLSTLNAIEILGVEGVRNVSAGNKFLIIGDVTEETVKKICERVLANGLIQDYSYRKIGGS
jgi:phosphoribosylformylglycinamidine (FGAM) synthase PurS component